MYVCTTKNVCSVLFWNKHPTNIINLTNENIIFFYFVQKKSPFAKSHSQYNNNEWKTINKTVTNYTVRDYYCIFSRRATQKKRVLARDDRITYQAICTLLFRYYWLWQTIFIVLSWLCSLLRLPFFFSRTRTTWNMMCAVCSVVAKLKRTQKKNVLFLRCAYNDEFCGRRLSWACACDTNTHIQMAVRKYKQTIVNVTQKYVCVCLDKDNVYILSIWGTVYTVFSFFFSSHVISVVFHYLCVRVRIRAHDNRIKTKINLMAGSEVEARRMPHTNKMNISYGNSRE